ncbi:MAG: hypothetical protein ACE5KZ_10370 [Candidatus Scalinduaceae bacterium]
MIKKKQSKTLKKFSKKSTTVKQEKKSFPVIFDFISSATPQEINNLFTFDKTLVIDSLKDSAYKVPRFSKIVMLTEASKKLQEEEILMSGIKGEVNVGTIRGNDKPIFFYHKTDIQKFLAKSDNVLSSKHIKLAFKECYEPEIGYYLFPVSPYIEKHPYDVSIRTLCITESDFKKLKRLKRQLKSVDRKKKISDIEMKKIFISVKKECQPKTFGYPKYFKEVENVCLSQYKFSYTPKTIKKKYYEIFTKC